MKPYVDRDLTCGETFVVALFLFGLVVVALYFIP